MFILMVLVGKIIIANRTDYDYHALLRMFIAISTYAEY